MVASNGTYDDHHHGNNGVAKPAKLGAKGVAYEPGLCSNLRYLRRIISSGERIEDSAEKIVAFLEGIIEGNYRPREKIAAARTLAALRGQSIAAAPVIDKIERLDAGDVTERIGTVEVEAVFDRRG